MRKWKSSAQKRCEVDPKANDDVLNKKIINILQQRAINSEQKIRQFMQPDLNELFDPFLMKDMNLAVQRITDAIVLGHKILLYGDFDVDGCTSIALLFNFFKNIYGDIDFYIPCRIQEGYGFSDKGLNYAIKNNIKLIIFADCGSADTMLIQKAKASGIDSIICDHHNIEKKPDAWAILNPKQKDCKYPFKQLSACGIAFKLIHALSIEYDLDVEKLVYSQLDLVCMSIACDLVPVVEENRIMAHHGLQKLNKMPNNGVKKLISMMKIDSAIDLDVLLFKIGPVLNAGGRIGHAAYVVKLLTSAYDFEQEKWSRYLIQKNSIRRHLQKKALQEIETLLAQKELNKFSSILLFNSQWHPGILGILASKISRKYEKPVVIMSSYQEKVIGSVRSCCSIPVIQLIRKCGDFLTSFGGHEQAAGIQLETKKLTAFSKEFERLTRAYIKLNPQQKMHFYDECIEPEEIDEEFIQQLNQLAPFGPGNLKPVFRSDRLLKRAELSHSKNLFRKFELNQKSLDSFSCISYKGSPKKIKNKSAMIVFEALSNTTPSSKKIRIKDFIQKNEY